MLLETVAAIFAAAWYSAWLCPVTATTGLVAIEGEFNFSRFANIEAKQLGIFWKPELAFLPSDTADFLSAGRRGLWRSALDGPAHAGEQVLVAGLHSHNTAYAHLPMYAATSTRELVRVLQVTWAAHPGKLSFRLFFHFSSNETHWYLSQTRLQTPLFSASAIWTPSRSNDHRLHGSGHAIAAIKGKPFECHYMELPLLIDDLQLHERDVSMRCVVTTVGLLVYYTINLF